MYTAAVIDFGPDGQGGCLYTEELDLRELGTLRCRRAAYVEFSPDSQKWEVRGAGDGRLLYSHRSRSECLAWERESFLFMR